ncbi:hypothetical protein LTR84_000449 [Exophiala bonariae]|uniref:Uncharacterized protein n=1 Tax=Exophiala bonariae TaxID=1690606 RepID=A0AAV9NR39_9EURO|nr:hypothetical protein LTR84_000449 [Exophiala bonariae]
MALQCPHQHVSYATWRLQVIRSLIRSESQSLAALSPSRSAWWKRDYRTSQYLREDRSNQNSGRSTSEPNPSVKPTVKKSTPPNPFDSEGIDRLQDALAEVRVLHQQRVEKEPDPRKGPQKSQPIIYESPVKRILERSAARKSHKRQPNQEEKASLYDNLWARILATPIRSCFSSGTRLPIALLSDWDVVQEPKTKSMYLMPTGLADLDGMEKNMVDAVRKEAWIREPNSRQALEQRDITSKRDESVSEKDSDIEYVKPDKKANPVLSFAKSRVFMYVNYLRYLTIMLGKQRPPTGEKRNQAMEYNAARLLHPRNREKFGLATHYERNRVDVAMKTGQIEKPPPDSEKFQFQHLKWQPEISERLTNILQKRVVVALRETIRVLNESDRKQHERIVLPLAIPRTRSLSVIKRHGYREALFAQLKAQLGETDGSKQVEGSTNTATYPDFDELVEGPPIHEGQAPQPPPSWLAGSILLHIGRGDIEQLLNSESKPTPASPYLPPLPKNNMIPTMIPVAGAYRLPVFSVHHLFARPPNDTRPAHPEASADLSELADIINTCPSFNFAWPPVMPALPLYSPTGDAALQGPEDFLVLIKAFPGGPKTLIEEIWRLWRYIGGRAYGHEPVFHDTAFRGDPVPEESLDEPATEKLNVDVTEERQVVPRAETHGPIRSLQQQQQNSTLTSGAPASSTPQLHSASRPSMSSSFGLTMSRKEFKTWLGDKYPAAPDALVRYEPLCK